MEHNDDILNFLPSLLFRTGADGLVSWSNPAARAIFGANPNEESFDVRRQLSLEPERAASALDDCVETRHPIKLDDLRYTDANGVNGYLGFTLFPQLSAKEELLSVVWFGADITKRKEMERQLLQAQKMEAIGHLSAGIAHEINTPAQYIADNLNFLKKSFRDILHMMGKYAELAALCESDAVYPELVRAIRSVGDRLDVDYLEQEVPEAAVQAIDGVAQITKIVTAMKDFVRPETKNKELCNLNHLVQNSITISSAEWKRFAEVEADSSLELLEIYCIRGAMAQVFINLILNAADAIETVVREGRKSSGKIVISGERNDKSITISISDDGCGIPEENQGRIFDPFFTTKPVGRGTGQGLAVVYDVIVTKHQGRITFDSEPGKGTVFYLHLPLS
jgi:two-component system, NtrC family, sensor kinase